MIYGPGDMFHRFWPVVKRVRDGRHLIIVSQGYANWRVPRGFVDSVAHAIALAATTDIAGGRLYNVCEEPSLPELEWQEKIAKAMNFSGKFVALPPEHTPKHLMPPLNVTQSLDVSSARIRAELGFAEPVQREEAILRTIAWEEKNPPGPIDPQQFDYAAEDAALMNAA